MIDDAVKAHGGLGRWLAATSLSAPVSIGGSLWADKAHDGVLADAAVFIDPHRQHVEFSGFGPQRLCTWFEPGLVTMCTEDGTEIGRRRDPLASFPQGAATAWDNIQVAYFASYAIWNYLTLPNRLVGVGYWSCRPGRFLCGLPSGDAWFLPALDVLRKSGAPDGRSRFSVVGCRCSSPPQGRPPERCSRASSSSIERGPVVCWSHGRLVR